MLYSDCGALSNPNGATADTSAGTTYQSVATFTCNTGYVMNGVSTSTCQANGQWDNTDPVCTIQSKYLNYVYWKERKTLYSLQLKTLIMHPLKTNTRIMGGIIIQILYHLS